MATKSIKAELLAKMFLAGAKSIEAKKEFINELNVFPVPDGDTGTNMTLTIMSAASEVVALNSKDLTMETLAKAISSGSLRGARGNSGVILSQLFRGFTKEIAGLKEVNVAVLAEAAVRAKETAYKAVMKPKEGTILTVARGIADKAVELAEETDDIEIFFPAVIEHAKVVLDGTPDLLPVLKEAGVVDSGGQGLLEILKGAYDAFLGKEIEYETIAPSASGVNLKLNSDIEITFGYCTEFIIVTEKEFSEEEENKFKAYLESIGDSVVCVADEEYIKVHVHTNAPGLAIQKALTFGQLTKMKIDNMREEHQEKVIKDAERKELQEKAQAPQKECGFIAVSIGDGINSIFKELGVDYLIEGGQTMNPSTEDMLKAIESVNAKTIFILPNNKNIILAANQAKELTEDKNIIVIPTKTVPQGVTAVISFNSEADVAENEKEILEAIENVKSGQVTYAVRDTKIDDKEIKEGNIMGIGDAGILSVGTDIETTTKEMLSKLVDEETSIISLYYGSDVTAEDATRFTKELEEQYPDVDIDTHFGGQPIYYYVLAVE